MSGVRSLNGAKALVTGAGKRVGQAIALGLAREGCDVIVHYSSSVAGAKETVAEITKMGRRAVAIQADFRTVDGPRILAEKATAVWGGLDILINSASVYPSPDKLESTHTILKESVEDWELSLAVNARAPFFLIQHLASTLKQSENGNVINILDRSVNEPFRSRASHTVSKWGLAAISQLAAKTLQPEVRVNSLLLGGIIPGDEMKAEEREKNDWLGVEDVVAAAIFVLKTPSVNGETIQVKGSRHLRPSE